MAPTRLVRTAVAVAAVAALAGAAAGQYSEVDIAEANVMGVEWEGDGEQYRFDVTLYHDDSGEDGYADWWQVETLDGERLGRRSLAHAHGTQQFTRSTTVGVPSDVTTVVVRGHDQTHGYGGRAVVVDIGNGTARTVDQGTEPRRYGATGSAADGDAGDGADEPDADSGDGDTTAAAGDTISPNDSGTSDPDGTADDADDEAVPGPGPLVAVLALSLAAVLRAAGRRRR